MATSESSSSDDPGLLEAAHVVIRHWELFGQRGYDASIQYLKRVVDRIDREAGKASLDTTVLEVRPSLVRRPKAVLAPAALQIPRATEDIAQVVSNGYQEREQWRGMVGDDWADIVKGVRK